MTRPTPSRNDVCIAHDPIACAILAITDALAREARARRARLDEQDALYARWQARQRAILDDPGYTPDYEVAP